MSAMLSTSYGESGSAVVCVVKFNHLFRCGRR